MTTTADEQARDRLSPIDDSLRPAIAGARWERRSRDRRWLIHRALAAADVVGLLLALLLTLFIAGGNTSGVGGGAEIAFFVLSVPVWIAAFKIKGLYDNDEATTDYSTIDDIAGVFGVVTIGAWLLYLVGSWTGVIDLSTRPVVTFWLIAIFSIPICRAAARMWARSRDAYVQNVLIVGTGAVARLFARKIAAHPEYGLRIVGFVDVAPVTRMTDVGSPAVLGSTAEVEELVAALSIDRIVVSFTEDSPEETMRLIRAVRNARVQVDIVPRLFEVMGTNSTMNLIEGTPLVGLPRLSLSPSSRFLKRALDLTLTVPSLVLIAPLLAVVAVAIKLESPGPVFFRQIRRGEGDTTFSIFKFRSMVADADERRSEVSQLNIHASTDPRMFKAPDDPRTTRLGAFLRRWSIDEIPQLFNVLRGEMSLVGPRPLILEEDQHVVDWARARLWIKPGLTGLWQVLGRSDIPFDEMTKLDYVYVTSWSLRQDIRLILLTVPALARPRRAA